MRFSTPEKHGIPSKAIADFVNRLNERQLPMHSFLMMRGGECVAEGYWKPFDKDFHHRLYSCSKSFVSIAIGLLEKEGKLSLDDKIVSFFPEKMKQPVHPYMQEATIRHLLMMSTPHNVNAYSNNDADWLDCFLNRKPDHHPGLVFSYDTAGTVTLNAIVEKVSGQELVEFLRPRLFDPLGVTKDAWCVGRPEGGAWGGSGMMLTTRDFAMVANTVLHYGKHEGKQLLPEEYLKQATAKQIDNRVGRDDPECQQGYGYQFWRTKHNGFAFVGMGSQLAICLPEKDFCLITTADTQGLSCGYADIYGALWDIVYPYLKEDAPIEGDGCDLAGLLDSLTLFAEIGDAYSPMQEKIAGKTFVLDENPMGISKISFDFPEGECVMCYTNGQGDGTIRFGFGRNIEGEFPQKGYYGKRIREALDRGYRCLCSCAWGTERNLELKVNICDWYFGNCNISVGFEGENITILMTKTAEWFLNEFQGFAAGKMV